MLGVYGLSLNWEKTEVLPIGCDADMQGPNGEPIKNKTSLVYLGSVISASGSITSEVNRRLWMAKTDFDALNRVWKHARLRKRGRPDKHGFQQFFAWLWICAAIGLV